LKTPIAFCRSLVPVITASFFALATAGAEPGPAKEPLPDSPLFATENLVAWCIVPFDNLHRTPVERVAMLKRLGFSQYAWDWRQEHLKDLPAEIKISRKAGIRIRAIWLWIEGGSDTVGHLGAGNRTVLDDVKAANLSVEYWVGFHPNFFVGMDEPTRIRRAAEIMIYLRNEAAKSHSTVAFYNHGDWIGEPDNQIKIIKAMGDPSIGLVFNFHHAHTMLNDFPGLLARMQPYLKAVNLDGIIPEGPKIVPLGQGTREREMIRLLVQSGYKGPLGILGHVEDSDIEGVLRKNLEGLRSLTKP
jgi:sugar phosphate isomerase/epimerase